MSYTPDGKREQFLMLIQTGAIVNEVTHRNQNGNTPGKNSKTALQVLSIAMEAVAHIPERMSVYEAAAQFIECQFSEESVPYKPQWLISAGL